MNTLKNFTHIPARKILLALGLTAGGAFSALAGTDSPLAANLSINYQPPGARSQAMGGTFIGLADDATTILVNPAGLVQLSKPELMTQFYSNESGLDLHNYFGFYSEQTGPGNTSSQVLYNDIAGSVGNGSGQGLNFMSYAHPFEKGVVAVAYSRPVDFHANGITLGQNFENRHLYYTPPDYCDPFFFNNCAINNVIDPPQSFYGRLKVEALTVAGALKITPKFSLGVSLSVNRVRQDFRDYFYFDTFRARPGNLRFIIRETANETDVSGGMGILWKPSEKFQAGANFRRGFSYGHNAEVEVVSASVSNIMNQKLDTQTRLPDQFGIGVVWRPIPIFVIALDINRVRYSQLLDGMKTFDQYQVDRNARTESFTIEDGTEPHLGFEYVALVGGAPMVFRAGAWQEQAHGLKFVENAQYFVQDPSDFFPIPEPDVYNRFVQTLQKNRFPGGEDEMHYSVGIGLVLAQKVQLDMGYDYSRLSKQFVMSGIYRFGYK